MQEPGGASHGVPHVQRVRHAAVVPHVAQLRGVAGVAAPPAKQLHAAAGALLGALRRGRGPERRTGWATNYVSVGRGPKSSNLQCATRQGTHAPPPPPPPPPPPSRRTWLSSTSRASPCRDATMNTRRRRLGMPKPAGRAEGVRRAGRRRAWSARQRACPSKLCRGELARRCRLVPAVSRPAAPTCRVDHTVGPALVAQLNELLGAVLQGSRAVLQKGDKRGVAGQHLAAGMAWGGHAQPDSSPSTPNASVHSDQATGKSSQAIRAAPQACRPCLPCHPGTPRPRLHDGRVPRVPVQQRLHILQQHPGYRPPVVLGALRRGGQAGRGQQLGQGAAGRYRWGGQQWECTRSS